MASPSGVFGEVVITREIHRYERIDKLDGAASNVTQSRDGEVEEEVANGL